jgi:hypothetical protein
MDRRWLSYGTFALHYVVWTLDWTTGDDIEMI